MLGQARAREPASNPLPVLTQCSRATSFVLYRRTGVGGGTCITRLSALLSTAFRQRFRCSRGAFAGSLRQVRGQVERDITHSVSKTFVCDSVCKSVMFGRFLCKG